MSEYTAPIDDMRFVLQHIVKLEEFVKDIGHDDLDFDLIDAILEEGGKLASSVWAPTNEIGDIQHSVLQKDHSVKTPDGYKDAYQQFSDGGWGSLSYPEEFGGQDLPHVLSLVMNEMWQSANMALSLCPLLTGSAIEALLKHGSEKLQNTYLPKLISGEWTGTMNLTEPQAGTDLAAIRCIAKKDASGDFYRLKGQKIFITFGEHDFTENIVHLVLARVDGLPAGNNGLGLFVVPKFLVNEDGSLGDRNEAYPISLERKMGINGSPTCVMAYGDDDGAIAYIVGEEGAGLKNMFTMMNDARIGVGVQSVSQCERSYQHALEYAKERVQGFNMAEKGGDRVTIIEHPDVRRMLLTMRAYTEAARAMAYYAGSMIDKSHIKDNPEMAKMAQSHVELLTPLVKSWISDLAVEISSTGIQIHGGTGYIEESGAAQFYRDSRILPIYEGANGIHGLDLVFRKVLRDGGATITSFIAQMKDDVKKLYGKENDDLDVIYNQMMQSIAGLEETTTWILANAGKNTQDIAGSASLYLTQVSTVIGGCFMAQSALAAFENMNDNKSFCERKLFTSRFYAEALLPQVDGLKSPIMGGHSVLAQMTVEQF